MNKVDLKGAFSDDNMENAEVQWSVNTIIDAIEKKGVLKLILSHTNLQ